METKLPQNETLDQKTVRLFETSMREASEVAIDDRAVYYSFRALIAKFYGDTETAQLMLSSAKPFIMDRIDQIATDSVVATCAVCFVYFYMFEEDYDRVNFFISNVKQFVKKNHRPGKVNMIEISYKESKRLVDGKVDVELSLKTFLMQYNAYQSYLVNTRKIPALVELITDAEVESMTKDLSLDENTTPLDINRVMTIADRFPKYCEQFMVYYPNATPGMLSTDKYLISMMLQSLIIEKGPSGEAEFQAATQIAHGTLSPMFMLNCVYFFPVLRKAVHVHLRAVQVFGKSQSLIELLELELHALEKMRVVPSFNDNEDLIDVIKNVLSKTEQPQYLVQIPASSAGDELLDQFFSEFF